MNLIKVSKKLSYLLRHCTDPLYIDLKGGWADVNQIITVLKSKYSETDLKVLEKIVDNDEKGRYSFNSDHTKIRANQGHSIPDVIIEMEQPDPPELLYHGTATRFLPTILEEGLKPMTRQYVHISADPKLLLKSECVTVNQWFLRSEPRNLQRMVIGFIVHQTEYGLQKKYQSNT